MCKSILFEKDLQSNRFKGISWIKLWLRLHDRYTTIKKILNKTPGGRNTFSSPTARYKQLQSCVAVDTFDHEAIQPFGGGAVDLAKFQESN